jgi:thiamine pyrophosphate-dependent acetolactate synthase large subunit-like protein
MDSKRMKELKQQTGGIVGFLRPKPAVVPSTAPVPAMVIIPAHNAIFQGPQIRPQARHSAASMSLLRTTTNNSRTLTEEDPSSLLSRFHTAIRTIDSLIPPGKDSDTFCDELGKHTENIMVHLAFKVQWCTIKAYHQAKMGITCRGRALVH